MKTCFGKSGERSDGGKDNFKNFLQFAKNFFSKFVIVYLRIINYAVLYVYWGDTNLFDKDH